MSGRLLRLMRVQINVGFGISSARYYYIRKRERLWEAVLIPLSILTLAAFLGFGVFKFASAYYRAYAVFGQGDAVLLLGVMLCQILTLVLGFALVIGNFYYANDLPLLIPLPFRPWEVLAGKLALLLTGEYAVQAVFFLPVLLVYGRGGVVPFGLTALIVFLALPVIPLALAAIPAVLLMRVLGEAKRRDNLLVIAGFLFIIIVVGGQFYLQSRMLGPEGRIAAESVQRILGTAHGIVDWLGRLYPPAAWAARALAEPYHGLPYLLLFCLVSAIGLAAFFCLGEAIFYEGVLHGTEASGSNRRNGAHVLARGINMSSPVAGLAKVETLRFVRTPVYILNGFAGFILFPILFLLPAALESSPEMAKAFAAIRSGAGASGMGAMIFAAYFALLTAMSTIPFTAFSREGRRNIWILKMMPASGSMVARAKIRGSLMMILPGGLPGAAVLEWMFRFPAADFAAGLIMGALASHLICSVGAIVDLARPMLDWVSQEKAIKSNLNAIFSLALGGVIIAAVAFGIAGLFRLGLPAWAAAAVLGMFLAVLSYAAGKALPRLAERLWEKLDV